MGFINHLLTGEPQIVAFLLELGEIHLLTGHIWRIPKPSHVQPIGGLPGQHVQEIIVLPINKNKASSSGRMFP